MSNGQENVCVFFSDPVPGSFSFWSEYEVGIRIKPVIDWAVWFSQINFWWHLIGKDLISRQEVGAFELNWISGEIVSRRSNDIFILIILTFKHLYIRNPNSESLPIDVYSDQWLRDLNLDLKTKNKNEKR